MNRPRNPNSLSEDEEMDPVGLPYPEQQDPTSPDAPSNEPDIPEDSEFERIVQPVPPNS